MNGLWSYDLRVQPSLPGLLMFLFATQDLRPGLFAAVPSGLFCLAPKLAAEGLVL